MCLRPLHIKPDGQESRIVPCSKCPQCLARRSASWAFRLEQEQKISTSSCFITLTYENPPLTKNGLSTLQKTDFQKFMKRLRKAIHYQTQNKLKYYACGEYGGQLGRPHYHLILFNLPSDWINSSDKMHQTWGLGHIQIDPCNGASIRYVTNYVTKSDPNIEFTDQQKEFSLMSKNMGINYLSPQMKEHHRSKLINYIQKPSGQVAALPRYYKDKLFDDEMKEIISEAAEEARNIKFEEFFNNSHNTRIEWNKSERRKSAKANKQARNKEHSKDNGQQLIREARAKLTTYHH